MRCPSTATDIPSGLRRPGAYRGVLHETTDQALECQIELYERWHGAAQGRIHIWFNLRTIFNNSDAQITRTKDLADRYQTGIQMHVAEIREEVEATSLTEVPGRPQRGDPRG